MSALGVIGDAAFLVEEARHGVREGPVRGVAGCRRP